MSIIGALASAVILSLQSMHESNEFPVQTYIETVPISSVPFPAVSVNAHDFVEYWTMLRYFFLICHSVSTTNNSHMRQASPELDLVSLRDTRKRFTGGL